MITNLETNGFATKLMDPTDREALALNDLAVGFMKDLERNPQRAKETFNGAILPHMMRALRTVKVLDTHLEAHALEIKKLLRANVVMIDLLKQKGIDMPNFAAIEDEVIREHVNMYGERS